MADDTKLHVGTSGFSYAEWKPAFYPEHVKKAGMLSFYASQLPSVELNNTFYRMPTEKNVTAWSEQVPDTFRFAIKATRRMTWSNKLVDCGELLAELFTMLAPLGGKLGCVFYQLPKFVKCDLDVLRSFLKEQPSGIKAAFEFVHESWHDKAVFDLLHEHGATAVASDKDDAEQPELAAGAPWLYLRLRRASYGDDELRMWRDRIQQSGVSEAFVFFKHEDTCAGPALARRFRDL
ncbi:MAG: hypothetical protein ACI8UD_002659 [Planctomycetota bacterium]|jgi:uncharacterized protein YecE (DUF72 family)